MGRRVKEWQHIASVAPSRPARSRVRAVCRPPIPPVGPGGHVGYALDHIFGIRESFHGARDMTMIHTVHATPTEASTNCPRSRPPISLVLIDDNHLLREGIAALIDSQSEFKVIGASADVDEALRKVREEQPDIVLIDIGLAHHNSVRLTATVRKEVPAARIIIMGLLPLHLDVTTFVRAGASGFVMKDASLEDFLNTIRRVETGAEVLPTALTHSLFAQIALNPPGIGEAQRLESMRLSVREIDVVELLGDGLSNKEIAERLNIAVHTVKSHVHNVLEKLALHSRLEVAAFRSRSRRRRSDDA